MNAGAQNGLYSSLLSGKSGVVTYLKDVQQMLKHEMLLLDQGPTETLWLRHTMAEMLDKIGPRLGGKE